MYSNHVLNEITCVRYNHNGYYVAFGDAQGGVKVIGWSGAENNYVVKYEKDGVLGAAAVHDIAFDSENKKIAVVGAGGSRAKSINIEENSGCGEISGHSATLLSVDIKTKRPFKCVLTGEDKEIHIQHGPPFKYEKSIQNAHGNFGTKVAFTPWDEGAHFITVSSDKSIKVWSTETNKLVFEQQGLHAMGINDFCFTSNEHELITCSSDRTAKVWKVDFEENKLHEVRTLGLSEADLE